MRYVNNLYLQDFLVRLIESLRASINWRSTRTLPSQSVQYPSIHIRLPLLKSIEPIDLRRPGRLLTVVLDGVFDETAFDIIVPFKLALFN